MWASCTGQPCASALSCDVFWLEPKSPSAFLSSLNADALHIVTRDLVTSPRMSDCMSRTVCCNSHLESSCRSAPADGSRHRRSVHVPTLASTPSTPWGYPLGLDAEKVTSEFELRSCHIIRKLLRSRARPDHVHNVVHPCGHRSTKVGRVFCPARPFLVHKALATACPSLATFHQALHDRLVPFLVQPALFILNSPHLRGWLVLSSPAFLRWNHPASLPVVTP
jgi:hypothetical protein